MNRRQFLSALAGVAVVGTVGRSTVRLASAATADGQLAPQIAFNFGSHLNVIGSYETAQGTYALLKCQGFPFWLHSTDGQTWLTTTPPWRVRRMANRQGGSQ